MRTFGRPGQRTGQGRTSRTVAPAQQVQEAAQRTPTEGVFLRERGRLETRPERLPGGAAAAQGGQWGGKAPGMAANGRVRRPRHGSIAPRLRTVKAGVEAGGEAKAFDPEIRRHLTVTKRVGFIVTARTPWAPVG